MPTASDRLFTALVQGRAWSQPAAPESRDAERDGVRQLLRDVFEERYHQNSWKHFCARNAMRRGARADAGDDAGALWAGVITEGNPDSGQYQGTSFVWFPAERGSVAVLVIGTGGFGQDAHILGRPGHRRRLRALARLHGGRLWVKPDLLDLDSSVPEAVTGTWPSIEAALEKYGKVIYAAVAVTDDSSRAAVEDLLDLFAFEHDAKFKGAATTRWDKREQAMLGAVFPTVTVDQVLALLQERRFVILEGPPGTGKTRLALTVARTLSEPSDPTVVQFHPARTYEDFVVGLAPRPTSDGLAFEVHQGDLLVANDRAAQGPHVLLVDEINRGDLARVLGEAIFLFEPSEPDRSIRLPHAPPGKSSSGELRLSPKLYVLGTRNTADRSIARVDLAIRRRFAFLEVWPDLSVVRNQGVPLAIECYEDVLRTFTEHADDAALHLTPGHAYFLDPAPENAPVDDRPGRVARRLRFELLPLLRAYVDERMLGPATGEVHGLADRIETRVTAAGS